MASSPETTPEARRRPPTSDPFIFAHQVALLVMCALREQFASQMHPNMLHDLDFAIDAARHAQGIEQ